MCDTTSKEHCTTEDSRSVAQDKDRRAIRNLSITAQHTSPVLEWEIPTEDSTIDVAERIPRCRGESGLSVCGRFSFAVTIMELV